MKLRTRINITTIVISVVVFSFLGIILYSTQKNSMNREVDERMKSHLDDLYTILNDHVNLKQEAVNISLNLAENIFLNSGRLYEAYHKISVIGVNQITKQEKVYEIPRWEINGKTLYNNFEIVDLIKSKSVESATVFQKIEDGYLRISTNVLKSDGQRAVGTYIPSSSAVVTTVEKGETYYGRAFVVDDWYLTAYKPIRLNGIIKGMLYVGIKEKDYKFLKNVLSNKKYYSSGYPFLIRKNGDFIIHPEKEGQNSSQSTFFKQLTSSTSTDYKSEYLWPENEDGKWKYQYFKYFEPYESYISVTVYKSDINASVNQLLWIICISVIIAIALLFFSLTRVLNPIINRIIQTNNFAQKISKGDLTNKLDVDQKDEIGVLANALQNMQDNLKKIITTIMEGVKHISQASAEMSSNSQSVSQGASEQAAAIEEISSSMEQMVAVTNQNADNANETEKNAQKSSINIGLVKKALENTISSVKLISEKTSIINEIATKTDLLAINASIEAARAGDYGKGFAVVAGEIRKLAEKSQNAAAIISELSANTVKDATNSGELLTDVIPDIEKTKQLVQEISVSCMEQRTGSNQINSAITQLNQVTQENAASAEELASSSEVFTKQAETLKNSVAFFRLDKKRDGLQRNQILVKIEEMNQYIRDNFNDEFENYHSITKEIKTEDKPPKKENEKGLTIEMDNKLDSEFAEFN